ncbi:O-antigen ligase family protein [Acidaminococcus sp. DS4831]|uniref:O-antigen ligase family protein n=1 Tax=Acidaminococcus sp. DS4831 TaxID=3141399 RepID=UPI0032E4F6C8
MPVSLRDKLFFSIVLFIIFPTIPKFLQLNFLGAFLGKDLSFYPILAGVLYSSIIFFKKPKLKIHKIEKMFFAYTVTYIVVTLISFIHGLMIYPYYEGILSGPADQIEKLPIVQQFLSNKGMHIETTLLLKIWMFARLIKGFILETFWYFAVPYLVFSWYRKNEHEGFSILTKAVFTAVLLVCGYNILDFFYLSGSTVAEKVLLILNPIVHDIKSNGTWWPPLLWKGQLRSLFAEPSYYGIFSAFAMPFLWYRLVRISNTKSNALHIIIMFIFTYGLFLTKARTANALFFGELFLLIIFSLWKKNKQFLKKTAFIVSFSIITFMGATFSLQFIPGSPQGSSMGYNRKGNTEAVSYLRDNLGSLATKNQRSNRARFSILEACVAIGKDYPLLGVGKSLRNAYIPDYLSKEGKKDFEVQYWIKNQKEKGIMKSVFPALGEYSTRFAETGIFGLTIYLLPAVFLGFHLLKRIQLSNEQQEQEKCIFFFISFAGIMASGLGDNLSITCSYWILMGLGYALILSPYKKENHERT